MIILTMQLQRIVAERLGNLNRINLLLSRVYAKKSFVMTTVIAMLKYASFVWGDMTTNYHRIPSKFSRTPKVVIDRAFILLHGSIFYNVDPNWINFSQRAFHCNGLCG